MTTAVTLTPAPSARTGAPSDGGGSDSAAPFASALDGALGSGRPEVDGAGGQGGGRPGADQDETPEPDAGSGAPGEPAPPAPGGVVATAWALLNGPAKAAAAQGGPADGTDLPGAPGAAGHVAGGAPGLVRANEHAQASRTAHGLLGSSPARGTAEAPAAAPGGTSAAAPSLPLPVVAAAAALQAVGIDAVQVATEAPPATADPVPAVPGTMPAPAGIEADGAPASSSPVLLLPATAPDAATSNGAGESGTGSGTDRGPEAAAGTDPAPTAASGPPGPAATVARSETAPGTAAAPPVSGQIARQVAVLRGGPDGAHTMTVVLTPETLGPVEVSVTVSQGAVELTLRGAHEHGRAALAEALPQLRRDLEAAGLTCSRLDVDRGSSWSPSAHSGRSGEQGPGGHGGGRGHQQDRSDGGARPWHRSADTAEGRRAASRGASALDVRV